MRHTPHIKSSSTHAGQSVRPCSTVPRVSPAPNYQRHEQQLETQVVAREIASAQCIIRASTASLGVSAAGQRPLLRQSAVPQPPTRFAIEVDRAPAEQLIFEKKALSLHPSFACFTEDRDRDQDRGSGQGKERARGLGWGQGRATGQGRGRSAQEWCRGGGRRHRRHFCGSLNCHP